MRTSPKYFTENPKSLRFYTRSVFQILVCCTSLQYHIVAQTFEPIPEHLQSSYVFNFSQLFYKDSEHLALAELSLLKDIDVFEESIATKGKKKTDWKRAFNLYDIMLRNYRKIDLYLFLKYATNITDLASIEKSEVLYSRIAQSRKLLDSRLLNLTDKEEVTFSKTTPDLLYYLEKTKSKSLSSLTKDQEVVLDNFSYLLDSRFYDEALRQMTFDKIQSPDGEIDLINEPGKWQSHQDSAIRMLAEQKIFEGYASQKQKIGYGYIHLIKGLNVHAQTRGFENFLEEKLIQNQLPDSVLQQFFKVLSQPEKDSQFKTIVDSNIRFNILEATSTIIEALRPLGELYNTEVSQLLDPRNGRMDIVNGPDRIPIRGAASYLPIDPSTFYALNYEGFLIDVTLLTHEAGHAVQAALMRKNHVPMYYATGPAYFTESFGIFNELLLFDFLKNHGNSIELKAKYYRELKSRMSVVYGAAEEAIIEYHLITGIINGTINTPEDLDHATLEIGLKISPDIYQSQSFRRGLWMLLETNFRAPFHNIHDMIASLLALKYFQLYKSNSNSFVSNYLALLQNGYQASPENLLRSQGINIHDPSFCRQILEFAQKY